MGGSANPTEPGSLGVVYDLALKRLDAQLGEIESIDNKLRVVFWFATVVFTALLGFLSTEHFAVNCPSKWLFVATMVVFGVVAVLTFLGYRFGKPRYLPKVNDLLQHALKQPGETTKQAVLLVVARQIIINRKCVARRGRIGSWVFLLVLLEIMLAVVTLLVAVLV